MINVCLAVDIGASSGRMVAGWLEGEQLRTKEIHRFQNQMEKRKNMLCWPIDTLFEEILMGLRVCKKHDMRPRSMGIDTWAVDFVLLDEKGNRLTEAVTYRDRRTEGMMNEVLALISKEELYHSTGIQFQPFNTIYQLAALKKTQPTQLANVHSFLMIPDYLHFLLTGKRTHEYTNASSTQLLNLETKGWDHGILHMLGIKPELFSPIYQPGTKIGGLKSALITELGFDVELILPATHDTASAIVAVPSSSETIYLSSGTWSLIGIESKKPICDEKALLYGFTNEGGVNGSYRFLKNIMGLWMLQEMKRTEFDHLSFEELTRLAAEETAFHSVIEVNDSRFLMPERMLDEIKRACKETNQPSPKTPGQAAKCVYLSLAKSYLEAVYQIEEITGNTYETIHVVGGGCQNELLNQLLADDTNKQVFSGPIEATAIGNLIIQMISLNEVKDVGKAREIVRQSFHIKEFLPKERVKENDPFKWD
ncbi:rhamnulokinase [Bacillus sp. NPDC077027]|uniref:rhamnulokinase n=1 Tax=Bacillus sp. NPDC077027 TaxID=3390548 RepID=UPI003D0326D4